MTKRPKSTIAPRKKPARKRASKPSREAPRESQAIVQVPQIREDRHPVARPVYDGRAKPGIDQLLGDLPGVTLKDEQAVLYHFEQIDPRLAEAWKRDVVVHPGPITLRRVMYPASFGGATHYAYVDRRLLWYLRHDPSDQLGAHWDGYLANRSDAPPGTTAVTIGTDFVVKKRQLGEGDR